MYGHWPQKCENNMQNISCEKHAHAVELANGISISVHKPIVECWALIWQSRAPRWLKIADAKCISILCLFRICYVPVLHPKTPTLIGLEIVCFFSAIYKADATRGQAASSNQAHLFVSSLAHILPIKIANRKIQKKNPTKNDINEKANANHTNISHLQHGKGKHYAAKAVLCALTYLFDFNRPKKFTRINAKTLIYDGKMLLIYPTELAALARLRFSIELDPIQLKKKKPL